MKHHGINRHRFKQNPKEQAFAEAWEKEAPRVLGYVINPADSKDHSYSERDAQVAASVIQWLGSPVGSCFLEEVQAEIEAMYGKAEIR